MRIPKSEIILKFCGTSIEASILGVFFFLYTQSHPNFLARFLRFFTWKLKPTPTRWFFISTCKYSAIFPNRFFPTKMYIKRNSNLPWCYIRFYMRKMQIYYKHLLIFQQKKITILNFPCFIIYFVFRRRRIDSINERFKCQVGVMCLCNYNAYANEALKLM